MDDHFAGAESSPVSGSGRIIRDSQGFRFHPGEVGIVFAEAVGKEFEASRVEVQFERKNNGAVREELFRMIFMRDGLFVITHLDGGRLERVRSLKAASLSARRFPAPFATSSATTAL